MGIDLCREPVPDETMILKFRHLLEAHELGERLFELIGAYLEENGLRVSRGTIVDATVIEAPRSRKNREGCADPEMGATRKGGRWQFGMKLHVGVDSRTRLIHSVVATAAKVHDSQVLEDLLHGEERRVWGDAAYSGQREVIRRCAPRAADCTHRKGCRHRALTEAERAASREKSRVRAKGEHVFRVIKRVFGQAKVWYRGLANNANWLFVTCGLANLYMARRSLLAAVEG